MNIKDIIIYEDENILVLNKPRGVLSERDGDISHTSLDLEVEKYFSNRIPAMLINRLDKDTSGLIVFAKNKKAAFEMSKIFQEHQEVEKHYLVLVNGNIDNGGTIEAPLRKSFEKKKMIVAPLSSGAKKAISKYQIIKQYNNLTLLDVELLTGRTHQIRAHMSYIRHHVVGDKKYGDFKINNIFKKEYNFENQFLHSHKLLFSIQEGMFAYLSNLSLVAPLPNEEEIILQKLEEKSF